MRQLVLKVHRWSGLFLALFLIVAGLTGIALSYYEELDSLLIQQWVKVEPKGQALSPFELARVAEQREPKATVDRVQLTRRPGASELVLLKPKIDAATHQPYRLDFDQLFLDPYSGAVLGQRLWSENKLDTAHLMPMVHRAHHSLLMGKFGERLFGVVALVWFFNCFIGFYLSLPPRKRNFWKNWLRSWQVRSIRPVLRASFELHRAAALWVWVMLLVFSLSAVQFMLKEEVFRPVFTLLMPYRDAEAEMRKMAAPDPSPLMSWEAAHERGKALMSKHSMQQGFNVFEEAYLSVDRELGLYTYSVRSSFDIREHGGHTRVSFSGVDGRELQFFHSSISAGNALESWLAALHMRRIWGAPYQAFVALMGIVVVTLSVSGVLVWFKRRSMNGC